MRDLTILIKPASSLCNLKCKYCFYHSEAEQREHGSYGIMTDNTARQIILSAFDTAKSVTFVFQGGEPTIAGLDFLKFFINEVNKLNIKGVRVNYAIQTNGVGLSEEFAQFFRQYGFLVGLSLDGPKEINDWMRVDGLGNSVFQRTMDTSRLFNRLGIQYNILCVVTAYVASHIERVYRFYQRQGFQHLQFIPCLDPLDSEPFSQKFSLQPELYGKFLIRLFNLWADDIVHGKYISVRFFDNLLQIAAGHPAEQCGMQGRCFGQVVIESDGSIFPCDFYCVDNWRLGNIADMTIEQAYTSLKMNKFIETSAYEDLNCKSCVYFALCRGGCRRDRDARVDGVALANRYCTAYKTFFAEAAPQLQNLISRLRMG
jgi:uncharacterized protein